MAGAMWAPELGTVRTESSSVPDFLLRTEIPLKLMVNFHLLASVGGIVFLPVFVCLTDFGECSGKGQDE